MAADAAADTTSRTSKLLCNCWGQFQRVTFSPKWIIIFQCWLVRFWSNEGIAGSSMRWAWARVGALHSKTYCQVLMSHDNALQVHVSLSPCIYWWSCCLVRRLLTCSGVTHHGARTSALYLSHKRNRTKYFYSIISTDTIDVQTNQGDILIQLKNSYNMTKSLSYHKLIHQSAASSL